MGQWLSERLGQQFIIENRPGGGNNIGTEAVVRAPADGYTIALAFNLIEIKCYPRKAAYQRIAFLVELTEGLQFACDELIDKGAIHTGA
jgi:tripartite-type tricarboxylate transporter receptor subunit TctC